MLREKVVFVIIKVRFLTLINNLQRDNLRLCKYRVPVVLTSVDKFLTLWFLLCLFVCWIRITHLLSGLTEAQVLWVSLRKEFSERQSGKKWIY